MANRIHPLAAVDPAADIGEDCEIGPFCVIGPDVSLGAGCRLHSHVVVDGHTRIGAGCTVFPFASVGVQSQDLKFQPGNLTYTEIGEQTLIREHVTVHSGTEDGSSTRVGSHCALLALSHVGHNCEVGDQVILSHGATLGGHVKVEDHCNLGGLSAVHQFTRIGRNAMVAGMARVVQDVVPFTIAEGTPAAMRSINRIGMGRAGIDETDIKTVHKAFRLLFKKGVRLDEARAQLQAEYPEHALVQAMLAFIAASERGLARPQTGLE